MVSLAYYLRVVAAMWMQDAPTPGAALAATGRPAMAGGSAEAETVVTRVQPETWAVALIFGAATLFFGIVPSPLFNLAVHAGESLSGLF
jgi:NADH-quinone oxidoreductase subunit N